MATYKVLRRLYYEPKEFKNVWKVWEPGETFTYPSVTFPTIIPIKTLIKEELVEEV